MGAAAHWFNPNLFWQKNQFWPSRKILVVLHYRLPSQRRWTWTGDFKCREVKTGFCRKRWTQTGSSGTLIGWKSGQTTFIPLWDRMEGAWLWTQLNYSTKPVFLPRAELRRPPLYYFFLTGFLVGPGKGGGGFPAGLLLNRQRLKTAPLQATLFLPLWLITLILAWYGSAFVHTAYQGPQRDVVYFGSPIEPLYMTPNSGRGGGGVAGTLPKSTAAPMEPK